MADPYVNYEWDFDSPLRWEDEDADGGGEGEHEEEDEEDTAPRPREEEEGNDEDDLPLWGQPPRKRVRFVQFAPGPLDTLDG